MSAVRELVRQKMDGFEIRQMVRDGARNQHTEQGRVRRARKRNLLFNLEHARKWLRDNKVGWMEEDSWGIVTLKMFCGVTLYYRTDGALDARPPRSSRPIPLEEMELAYQEAMQGVEQPTHIWIVCEPCGKAFHLSRESHDAPCEHLREKLAAQ